MMNDSDNPELDNEMANLTDALLAGRSVKSSDAARSLESVVRGLQELSAPAQPSADFRSRLSQRLSAEFEAQIRTRRTSSFSSVFRRYRPLLTAAAVLVLTVVALFTTQAILQGTAGAGGTESTATVAILIVFVALLVVAGIFFWWRERK